MTEMGIVSRTNRPKIIVHTLVIVQLGVQRAGLYYGNPGLAWCDRFVSVRYRKFPNVHEQM